MQLVAEHRQAEVARMPAQPLALLQAVHRPGETKVRYEKAQLATLFLMYCRFSFGADLARVSKMCRCLEAF